MYQVYSQLRPGRPRWTLAANAFVLLLTVGLAAGVSNYKRRALQVALDKPSVSTRSQLRVRLPEGWTVKSDGDLPAGIAFVASDPGTRARRVIIFRDRSRSMAVASQHGRIALRTMCARQDVIFGGMIRGRRGETVEAVFDDDSAGPARLGVLPAWNEVALYGYNEQALLMVTGRVGVGPDGQIAGILIISGEGMSARDSVLLDQISQDFELLDAKPLDDPAAALKLAGVEFDLSTGVKAFSEQASPLSTLQLMGGGGLGAWYLDIARTPLLPGRTPQAILEDRIRIIEQATELPNPITPSTVGGKTLLQMQLRGGSTSILVALCKRDDQTALIAQGRCEPEGLDDLRKTTERVLTQARVTPYGSFVDLQAARQRGHDYVAQLRADGLGSIWGRYRFLTQRFALRSMNLVVGSSERSIAPNRSNGANGWECRVNDVIDDYTSEEAWRISDDTRTHRYTYDFKPNGGGYRYVETRENDELTRTLQKAGADSATKFVTRTDDVFVADPILFAAAARVATRPADSGEAVVLSATQPFTAGAHPWLILPAGTLPLPGQSAAAAAAVLICDFDPRPVYLYFDADLSLYAARLWTSQTLIRVRHVQGETD